MRIIVMFDLPVNTSSERREYTKFRKYLIKNGFCMLQESVYIKLATNQMMSDTIITNLVKNKPADGLVQALRITEKQFSKMEMIVGTNTTDVLGTDERLVIL